MHWTPSKKLVSLSLTSRKHSTVCGIRVSWRNSYLISSTDGSNDDGSGNKHFSIIVRTVDASTSDVRSDVLAIPVCKGSATGENILHLLNNEFASNGVPWENCLALGCDSANAMTRSKKGVFCILQSKAPPHLSCWLQTSSNTHCC